MTNKSMDYLLTFRADASQVQSEVANVQSALVGLHGKAETLNQQSLQGGSGFGALAEVAGATNLEMVQAAATSAALGSGFDALDASASRATTAMAQVENGVTGLTRSMADQVDEMLAVERSHAAWRDQLAQVRAQFNPIFAASQQYEQQLRRIQEAEDLGAISAREAAQARDRAAQIIAPINQELAQNEKLARGAGAANAYYFAQFNDIAMMAAMGQNPAILALQQGTQVNQLVQQQGGLKAALPGIIGGLTSMLNPLSLATIGIIGFGAAGIQALSSLKTETVSFGEHLQNLDDTLGRMRSNLELLENVRLGDTFGNLSGDVRGLAAGLLEIDRATELKQIQSVADTFVGEEVDESVFQMLGRSFKIGGSAVGGPGAGINSGLIGEDLRYGNIAGNYRDLGAANSYADFRARTDEIQELAKSGDVEAVVGKLLELQQAMSGDGVFTGMSDKLKTLMADLTKAGIETARIEAMWNGTAQAERLQKQVGDIVVGYDRQAELSRAILAHGENSAAVEEVRNRHARDALETRLKEMGVAEDSAERTRALNALEAQQAVENARNTEERRKALDGVLSPLAQDLAISREILTHGEQSLEVDALRLEHAKKALRLKLQELGATSEQVAKAEQLLDATSEMRRLTSERDAARLLADLQQQAQISDAILTHGRNSLEVKKLQIQAARQEFEEHLKTLTVSKESKAELLAQWEITQGLNSADPFGRLAAAQDMLSRQAETLAQLQLEVDLVGQSEAIRRRTLAIFRAEVEIRKRGIEVNSTFADQIREQAAAAAELREELTRQTEAWDKVQSAAEGAIDGTIDALLDGDFGGVLDSLIDEAEQIMSELALKNPVKNLLLGTDLPTLADVGGISGILGRISGQATPELQPALAAANAASMAVTTPMVMLNAANINGIPASVLASGGVSEIAGQAGASGLIGQGSVQDQVWQFFSDKGLAPHQVAAIMGNVSAESGFNPLAVGDGGFAHGLFQWNDRAPDLFQHIGGKGNLGDIGKQLEFAWHELLTSENRALRELMAAPDLRSATEAFVGFERPQGYTRANPAGSHGWAHRLSAAEEAMSRFGVTADNAHGKLSIFASGAETLGVGLEGFGASISGLIQGLGAKHGLGGIAAGSLLTGLGGLIGLPGFDLGGFTGGSDPKQVAGLVHEGEYVFDAVTTRRIGVRNLEAIRSGAMKGYETGGYVSSLPAPAINAGSPGVVAANGNGQDRVVFEMNVNGTGNAEIREATHQAISMAFDLFNREILPGRVRTLVNDRWTG
ncbi:MAG: phage tail tip lysozyme [Rhodobacteraceae bacterium]|nr:phage tail tip lysozyme [Paracoccaceae bacterium]